MLLMVIIFSIILSGCLEGDHSSAPGGVGSNDSASLTASDFPDYGTATLEVDPKSSISTRYFRTWGTLLLRCDHSMPYIMLNATLWKDGALITRARYMMVGLEPGRGYGFEILKSMDPCPPGRYSCILQASGPKDEILYSGSISCPAIESVKDFMLEGMAWALPEYRDPSYSPDRIENPEPLMDSYVAQRNVVSPGDSRIEPLEMSGAVIANKESKKYHRPDCRYASQMKAENRIAISSSTEAKSRGFTPCKVCNPI